VVHVLALGWQLNGIFIMNDTTRGFQKNQRFIRNVIVEFLGMLNVVASNTENIPNL